MKRRTTLMGILTATTLLLGPAATDRALGVDARPVDVRPDLRSDAAVDSPERIAHGCIARATKKGNACRRSIAKTAKRCVRSVKRLVEGGHPERAARVAEICEKHIAEKARRCSTAIEKHCDRCVRYLEGIGEPDLAARVKEACAKILSDIANLVRRARNAIADALGGGTGDFDEAV